MRCFESQRANSHHHQEPSSSSPPKSPLNSCSAAESQMDLDSICHLVQEGKAKAVDIRGGLKGLESTSQRLHTHVEIAKSEINDTFQVRKSMQLL